MQPVDHALSTITEESSQYSSSTVSVAVLPEVVVETSVPGNSSPTITTSTASGVGSGRDGRDVCTRPGHCCSCSRTTRVIMPDGRHSLVKQFRLTVAVCV